MKGDFSRGVSARPGVSRVLMQQGRVQLDADWNAAAAAVDRRIRTGLADVFGTAEPIGPAVVPRDAPGYAIAVRGGYRFDGKAALTAPHVPSLGAHERFTIEATVAPRSGGRGGTIAGRLAQEHHHRPHGEFAFRIDVHGRPAFLRVEHGGVRALIAPVAIPFDAHTDLAAVCQGDRVELFVAGRLVAARHASHGDHGASIPLLAGAHAAHGDGIADGFDGIIDRLAIVAGDRRFALDDFTPYGGGAAPERLPKTIVAGAGRAYVGGMLCENAADIALTMPAGNDARVLAYLEVAERLVSSADDPRLLDPALGGIDTAVVVRTDARLRIAPYDAAIAAMHGASARGTMRFARDDDGAPLGNQLARVEVHRSGIADETSFAYDDARLLDATRVDAHAFRPAHDPTWSAGQRVRFVAADGSSATATVLSATTGTYTVHEAVPDAAFRIAPIASVKWSLDNGSVAFPLDATNPLNVADPQGRVAALLPSSEAGPGAIANAIEVVSAANADAGSPGVLVGLASIGTDEPGVTTLTFAEPIDAMPAAGVLRAWSVFADGSAEAFVAAGSPVALTAGFTVTFTSGTYASGDFWWTALRDGVDGLWDWPSVDGEPQYAPPAGIARRFAPVALLERRAHDLPDVVDLRRIVDPLAPGGNPLAAVAPHERGAQREAEIVVVVGARARDDGVDDADDVDPQDSDDTSPIVDFVDEHDGEARDAIAAVVVDEPRREHGVLLTHHADAPAGYRATGMIVTQRPRAFAWETIGDAPGNGPALACIAGDALYVLFELSGELWAHPGRHAPERAGAWRRCADRGVALRGGALVALDGIVYAIGGIDDGGRPTARCDAYDPSRDAWTAAPAMHTARAAFGAAAAGGRLVVLGGIRRALGAAFATERVESWTPGEPRWRRERPLARRRAGCAAAARGRRVYLAGGTSDRFWAGDRGAGTTVDAVLPFEGLMRSHGTLATPQRDARAAMVDDVLVVAGGRTRAGDFAMPERYALGGDEGDPLPLLERIAPGIISFDGAVLAIAGESAFGSTPHVERCIVAQPLYVHERR